MSQLRSYAKGAWTESTLDVEAPGRIWDGASWVDIDLTTVVPEVPGEGEPEPTPVAAFQSLPGLQLFTDAADPGNNGTAPADKSNVQTLVSKAGGHSFVSPVFQGETAAQTAARAPEYRAATATEPPFLRFNGGNQRLNAATSIPMSGAVSIYVVARVHGLGYGTLFNIASSTDNNPCFVLDCGNDGRTRAFRRTDDGALAMTQQALLPGTWRVFSLTSADYSQTAFRVNEKLSAGAASTTSPTGACSTNIMSIASRVSGGTETIGANSSLAMVDIAAVVAYDRAHDTVTRQSVEQQLATRYKIVLPSQGGTIDGPVERITSFRQDRSVAHGIPATHSITGKTLPGFHNAGVPATVSTSDLAYHEGTYTTKSNGEVISKKWINGNVVIKHAGVVIQDSVISASTDPKIDTRQQPTVEGFENLIVRRTEILGREDDGGTGIGYIRYTVEDSYIHDTEDGVRLNKATNIRRNLMTLQSNGYLTQTERLHTDSVQSNGGDNDPGVRSYVEDNTLIALRHNQTKGNSAIILATEGANVGGVNQGSPLRRVTVNGNYLAGGSYTLYVKTMGTSGSPGPMEDIVITNNVFRGPAPANATLSSGSYQTIGDAWLPYESLASTFLTFTGNVRADGTALKVDRSTQGGTDAN